MQMTLTMRKKSDCIILLPLLNSKTTGIPENRLPSSDIYGITTVPYCKSTEHLVYRAAVPHGVELLDFTLLHWTALHPTVRHCTGY